MEGGREGERGKEGLRERRQKEGGGREEARG